MGGPEYTPIRMPKVLMNAAKPSDKREGEDCAQAQPQPMMIGVATSSVSINEPIRR